MARVAGLDVGVIVRTSLGLADAEGFDKLTMRRLSAVLDVTPMAIYHHVSSKDELLDLVIDESLRPLAPFLGGGTAEPMESLVTWFLGFHGLLVEHPSLAQAIAGRRLEGPHAAAAAQQMITLALAVGVEEARAVDLVVSAFSFALGAGLYRTSRLVAHAERGQRRLPEGLGLGGRLATAAASDDQFREGLTLLVAGYLGSSPGSSNRVYEPRTPQTGLR